MRCHLLLPWKYSGGLCYLKYARDRDSCVKFQTIFECHCRDQPCVVDLKDPVNEGFDQPQLVTKRLSTISTQTFILRWRTLVRQDKTLFILTKYIILRPGTANSVANLGWPGDKIKKQTKKLL